MTLRSKLLAAQLPLVFALAAVAVTGNLFTVQLGQSSQRILRDNYRSVLAAQRMKESIERIDSAALFIVAGRRDQGLEQARIHRQRFEEELKVEEGNITEVGEREAAGRLHRLWADYLAGLDRFQTITEPVAQRTAYFDELLPSFTSTKDAADAVLALNQDAMARKSDAAKRSADRSGSILAAVSILGCLAAFFTSTTLTSRLLRPLSVLAQASRRIGEGDLAARAKVSGRDEIAHLAVEFNTMADRMQKYRESSLGELLEAQQASQATIDSLPDPVLVLGAGGDLLHFNRAAEAILKIVPETGIAGLDPSVRSAVEAVHRHVSGGKGPFAPRNLNESLRHATAEGDRYFLPRATPVYTAEGTVSGTAIVLQEVTRLLRFEELRTNLVATVAHEFRTPLTSLRMAIHLLANETVGPLTEKQADMVFAAREDCDRLQSIVDDLLDLSRIQAGRMELRPSPVGVESLVRTALDAQRPNASQKQLRLRSEILPGTEPVLADPDRIQLVFANLLSNAIRHSPPEGTITVRALSSEGRVRFEVADQGPGIAPEYHQAIFEKYFHMPDAPSGSAGLGLFIVREIVQAHGGDVGVRSTPGNGATFWFNLKIATASQTRPGAPLVH